jgi:hypothetical protein
MWAEIMRKLQQHPGSLDVETEALDQDDDAYNPIEFAHLRVPA